MVNRRPAQRERGAAAVEFALVVPLLLMLVFGIISYGYMLSFRQALSQSATEGARSAAVTLNSPGGTEQVDAARNALDQALGSYGITCVGTSLMRGGTAVGTCAVTVAACSNDTSRDCASVAIDYDYASHPLLPTPGFGFAMPDNLGYTAVAEVS
ncbi:pilus assembly protein [Nocardioides ginkgobilobae]